MSSASRLGADGRARGRAAGLGRDASRSRKGVDLLDDADAALRAPAARPVRRRQKPRAALKRYRYGKGDMQIHYALDAPPRWKGGEELGKVALLHVTPGLDGVSRAANECERGLLPAEPTICVGQPTALDPSRAPEGKAILWLQLPEAPRVLKGDAKGEIADAARRTLDDRRPRGLRRPGRGAVLPPHRGLSAPGHRPQGLFARRSRGDERQSRRRRSLWRLLRPRPVLPVAPLRRLDEPQTRHVPGLYHIGASTHPGPGPWRRLRASCSPTR